MYCKYCGGSIADHSVFCCRCGKRIAGNDGSKENRIDISNVPSSRAGEEQRQASYDSIEQRRKEYTVYTKGKFEKPEERKT